MENSSEKKQSTEVMVRIYDLFDGIDALWVCGHRIERTNHDNFGCYEFNTDTMLPLSIVVANSCANPSTIAMMESTGMGQVCIRDGEWRVRTPRVECNMVEFMFRALDGASGVVELVVAVNECMIKNK